MRGQVKTSSGKVSAIRQSVTLPESVAIEVRRVAKERRLTANRALVELVQRGLQAEAEDRAKLRAAYHRFMSETDPERNGEAGKDLIRTIFGTEAIAEDSIR